MKDDLEQIREYWRYADEQEAVFMDFMERQTPVLADEIQDVLDHFEKLLLSGNLSKAEVERLHRKIRLWRESGYADCYLLKLYMDDLENRSRIRSDEALFISLFAVISGYYQKITQKYREVLQSVAEETALRELGRDKKRISDQKRIAELLEHLPDGTQFSSQMASYAQYTATRVAETARMNKQRGKPSRVGDPEFGAILTAGNNRLLKRSKPDKVQNYHGYLDRTLTAVVGYTVMDVFRKSGVKYYRFIAVMDGRTTDACRYLNGKVYKVSEMKLGVNVPPITIDWRGQPIPHPCRSIIRAVPGSAEEIQKAFRSSGGGKPDKPHTYKLIGHIDIQDENAVKSVIEAFEKRYVHANIENCLVITKEGDVYHIKGESTSVDTSLLGERMRDSISTHNHPIEKTQYSFSYEADLKSFLEDGSYVIRGFDEKYIYEIQRTNHTASIVEFDSLTADSYRHALNRAEKEGIPYDKRDYFVAHYRIQYLCQKLGINYWRQENANI